jgi:four helix bundle protein
MSDLILCAMSNFEKLNVWQRAIDLVITTYKLTENRKAFKSDFSLIDQMRRAAVSIPSNISEGDELATEKQAIKHFYISKGSAAELYTQFLISCRIGYLSSEEAEPIMKECKIISSMLSNLIKSRSKIRPDTES